MKIYEQDCGWAGLIVVVAESLDQAITLMKDCPNYDKDCPIVEHEIVDGLVICNTGDM